MADLSKTNPPGTNQGAIQAVHIGNVAASLLSKAQGASVLGANSRGLYIKTESRWVLFISNQPFKGPLTVNLPESTPPLARIPTGTPARHTVHITNGQIVIPGAGITICTDGSQVWAPPPPSTPAIPRVERNQGLTLLARKVFEQKGADNLTGSLPGLLGLPGGQISSGGQRSSGGQKSSDTRTTSGPDRPPQQSSATCIRDAVRDQDADDLVKALLTHLGSGGGLTPSGDDVITGVLFSLNRWRSALAPGLALERVNRQIVGAAYEKTTTLSANLIECASRGLADERLVQTLDGMMCARAPEPHFLDPLLGWGDSSGAAVFIGFIAAMSA